MNIKSTVSQLLKKKIIEVIAGGSNGSIVVFCLGEETITHTLQVRCVWRLEHLNEVIAGWNDSPDPQAGNLKRQMKLLEGDYVEAIDISSFYDLAIDFRSSKKLRIFCDITPNADMQSCDNWYVCDRQINRCISIDKNLQEVETHYRRESS